MRLWIGLFVMISLYGGDQPAPMYRLDRYYGGSSQGELHLKQVPILTEIVPMREEVFEAKEGRKFGGASQGPLDSLITPYLDRQDVSPEINHTVLYE